MTRSLLLTTLVAAAGALFAPAASAGPALDECWERSASRIELGACLRELRTQVDGRLDPAYHAALDVQRELDTAVGRGHAAARALERAQLAFELYRNLECNVQELQAGAGTGSGDFFLGCWIDLTRERIASLERIAGKEASVRSEEKPAPDLVGSAWLVEDIEQRGVVDRVRTTLVFGAEGKVAGNAGCNHYHGPIERDGETLALGPFATTRKMCPEAVMDQETRFLAALGKAKRVELDRDVLLVFGEAEQPLLRLTRTENPLGS